MYIVDDRDTVAIISDVPQMDVGAPRPFVLADEPTLVLGYFASGDKHALIHFHAVNAHMVGPPNDEALAGHPLAARGLKAYRAHLVHNSSWTRTLERLNRVHPSHDPKRFDRLNHYIFCFHDSTFECIAESLSHRFVAGDERAIFERMLGLLPPASS